MKPKILIVDDEAFMHMMMTEFFVKRGYDDITAVENCDSALSAISEKDFDVIFCDIVLGEKTGIDFLRQVNERGIITPVVMITGLPEVENVIEALRLGAFDFIRKPFQMKIILNAAEKAMKHKAELDRKRKLEEENKDRFDHAIKTYQLHLEKLQEQINSAVDIYQQLVVPIKKQFRIDTSWQHRPVARLGGDFIDVREKEDILDILVADVAGHDMGASYHTVLLKAFFEENCHKGNDGITLFQLLNRHLVQSSKEKRMITGVFVRICLENMKAEIVSAAHPWVVVLRKDNPEPFRILNTGGDVLGMHERADFDCKYFSLMPGDRLFIHTDGVSNASRLDTDSGVRRKLNFEGLDNFLRKYRDAPLEDMIFLIWQSIMNFCRNKPKDDMLLFGMEAPEA